MTGQEYGRAGEVGWFSPPPHGHPVSDELFNIREGFLDIGGERRLYPPRQDGIDLDIIVYLGESQGVGHGKDAHFGAAVNERSSQTIKGRH